MSFDLDPKLREWATENQWRKLEAWSQCGSKRKAAETLGCGYKEIYTAKRQVEAKAARAGYSPRHGLAHPYPDGFLMGKTTIQRNASGDIERTWERMCADRTRQLELFRLAAKEYLSELTPIKTNKGPAKFDTDVIPWFQIGDAHIGMLAHEAETGANFDLKIAAEELCGAFSILFDECPSRERCVINDLGDFTHYENMSAITENSGHRLDYDTRFTKMIQVYSRIMRFIIDRALDKFKIVDIIINQGNHSRTNDIWMAELLRQLYGDTNRVNVLDNSSVFIPYRMGNTFVMVHHSDKTRPEKLAQVMAHDYRQDWGETEYRYIDVGHMHHKLAINEYGGCTIEMWNTLAARDKWSTDGGYRAHQSITRVDRSRTYGEVGRRVLPIKEIRDIMERTSGLTYRPPARIKVHAV